MYRKSLLCSVFAGLLVFLPLPVSAVTVSWDFSGGLDTKNFTYTTNSNVSLSDTAGELQLTKPAEWYPQSGNPNPSVQGGFITSKFYLNGNFDIQVDYKIKETPLAHGVQIQLELYSPSYYSYLVRSNEDLSPPQNYHIWKTNIYGTTAAGDQGTMRVVRTGSDVTFYYKESNDWKTIWKDSNCTGDIRFSLQGQDNYNIDHTADAFNVSFDNLQVKADKLVGYVPLPGGLLLLGTGLLGLGAVGLRQRTRS